MFDWLFGKSRNDNMEQYRTERDNAQIDQQVNDFYKTRLNEMYNDQANAGLIADMRKSDPAFDTAWANDMKAIDMQSQQYSDAFTQANQAYTDMEKKQRHNYFGDGLLGAILNPVAQTATAGFDLATGNYKDRDAMSDIGATGETLLTLLPGVGAAAKGLKMGKVASGLGKVNKALYTIPGSMGTGAAFGGLEAMRQGGEDTSTDDVLRQAGIGLAFGGVAPAAIKFGGNVLRNRGAKEVATKYLSDPTYSTVGQRIVDGGSENVSNFVKSIANRKNTALEKMYGGLYQNALRSYVPKSTFGKVALGGGALYGGSQLMGMMGGQQEPQTIEDYYAMQGGY